MNFIFRRFSIRQIFIALVTVIAMLMALIVLAAYEEENANMALNRANEQRFSSFLLAAELRQSSDDLTRLARTYVVTGDPVYAQHYQTVLDIRDGRRARPQHYERIYWDFFDAEGRAPRPDSNVSAALTDLMRENGFTAAELSKLTEAKNISDTLVQIETRAMEMVKAQRAAGASANRNELEQARQMMHDASYHQNKARIMHPVDEFFAMLDQRTAGQVQQAQEAADRMTRVVYLLIGVSLVVLTGTLLVVYKAIAGPLAGAVEVARRVSHGDLTAPIDVGYKGETRMLLYALKEMRDGLTCIVRQVREGADSIRVSAAQVASGSQDLSSRTEEQAGSLEETAASMEQMNANVQRNAGNAQRASQLAGTASQVAREAGSVVAEVVTTMASIKDSSHRIVEIITVIDGIAFQTNILALNAAVEAARAGTQGRGFAVVAGEVRNLAQRAAAAAKEIKLLIDNSVDKVESGNLLVKKAGQTMADVVESVQRVNDLMGDIASASVEQSSGLQQISMAVKQLDDVTQQNATLVEQTSSASDSMQEQANRLAQLVGEFKLLPNFDEEIPLLLVD
ncbi:methyl-accepting chemotaxis protein [Herbaspirillum sp. VT-16-41]|uniref:methyl-accepting chemotaxis protein n=1 Tax=Herbaspirillum sp. VT-16-41 TaxID=1953765 RepID=UPI00098119CF|nr:methyl-accepting chemotaxis protein [Herbaspirillum sp. VT-16-41]ONN64220.1 methyl-accepting chemotaxis protein [Herbaspirillum sp. VT-16-41]